MNDNQYSTYLKDLKKYVTKKIGTELDDKNEMFNYINKDGTVNLLNLNNTNNLNNFTNNITEENIMKSFILNTKNYNNKEPIPTNKYYDFFTKNKPWAMYFAEDYDSTNNILYDCSGNNRHAFTSGNIIMNKSTTNGTPTYIQGDTNCKIDFPNGSIPATFTIASITKFTDTTNNKRILQGKNIDWYHGHNNEAYQFNYGDISGNKSSAKTDWITGIGKNKYDNNDISKIEKTIMVNGQSIGRYLYSISDVVGRRYPPTALTNQNTTINNDTKNTSIISGQAYGNGTYVTSASSYYGMGLYPYHNFDYDTTTDPWAMWHPRDGTMSSTSYIGTYSTLLTNGTEYEGEWIQIKLPAPIIITSYEIFARTAIKDRAPSSFKVLGSNNGISWDEIDDQRVNAEYSNKRFTPTSYTTPYLYYRLAMSRNFKREIDWLNIIEWAIYGNEQITSNYAGNQNDNALTINNSTRNSYKSNWALSCVIIWNNTLNDADINTLNVDFLNDYMRNGLNKTQILINDTSLITPNYALFNNNTYTQTTLKYIFLLQVITNLYLFIISSNNNEKNLINNKNIKNLLKNGITINTTIKADYNSFLKINTEHFSLYNNITVYNGTINQVTDNPNYSYAVFTASGTITLPSNTVCDVLIVGGGGPGGGSTNNSYGANCGGGGGGEVIYATNVTIPANTYNIIVGEKNTILGTPGNLSSAFGAVAKGGGYGGNVNGSLTQGGQGGSGGGGADYNAIGLNGSTSIGTLGTILSSANIYVNNGGTGYYSGGLGGGGGGGGAGTPGTNGNTTTKGNGGNGIAINITGTNYYWAGGGGGSCYTYDIAGNGGLGGGGAGIPSYESTTVTNGSGGYTFNASKVGGYISPGMDGATNTGSGGGGGGTKSLGGAGASGIVIVRFPNAQPPPVVQQPPPVNISQFNSGLNLSHSDKSINLLLFINNNNDLIVKSTNNINKEAYNELFNIIKSTLMKHLNFIINYDMYQVKSYLAYYLLCCNIFNYNLEVHKNISSIISKPYLYKAISYNSVSNINNRLYNYLEGIDDHEELLSKNIANNMFKIDNLNEKITDINMNIKRKNNKYKEHSDSIITTNYIEIFSITILTLIVIFNIYLIIFSDNNTIIVYSFILFLITFIISIGVYIYLYYYTPIDTNNIRKNYSYYYDIENFDINTNISDFNNIFKMIIESLNNKSKVIGNYLTDSRIENEKHKYESIHNKYDIYNKSAINDLIIIKNESRIKRYNIMLLFLLSNLILLGTLLYASSNNNNIVLIFLILFIIFIVILYCYYYNKIRNVNTEDDKYYWNKPDYNASLLNKHHIHHRHHRH